MNNCVVYEHAHSPRSNLTVQCANCEYVEIAIFNSVRNEQDLIWECKKDSKIFDGCLYRKGGCPDYKKTTEFKCKKCKSFNLKCLLLCGE